MVKEHKLNVELSKQVYEQHKEYIKMKQCYNNIYNVYERSIHTFSKMGWKIAYGFVTAHENLMARHCFIVTKENEVIDPTFVSLSHFDESEEYLYLSYELLEPREYLSKLEKNDCDPSMMKSYIFKQEELRIYGLEKGLIFMG